jgi:hypothetical protein
VKVGDLVRFLESKFFRIENPEARACGLIVEDCIDGLLVLWADGSSSVEHRNYLEVINENI